LPWSFENGDVLAHSIHFDIARSAVLRVEWREKMIWGGEKVFNNMSKPARLNPTLLIADPKSIAGIRA
jgi:hypothetical protein